MGGKFFVQLSLNCSRSIFGGIFLSLWNDETEGRQQEKVQKEGTEWVVGKEFFSKARLLINILIPTVNSYVTSPIRCSSVLATLSHVNFNSQNIPASHASHYGNLQAIWLGMICPYIYLYLSYTGIYKIF